MLMDGYELLLRRKLLEDLYDKLSPEDKKAIVMMKLQDEDRRFNVRRYFGL